MSYARRRAEASSSRHPGIEAAEHPAEARDDDGRIKGYLREAATQNAAWDDWFRADAISTAWVARFRAEAAI